MKNLFWKESETNWIGIYIQFLQSIQKIIENSLFCRISKASETRLTFHQPDELQDFFSAHTKKDFNPLEEEKFSLNAFE